MYTSVRRLMACFCLASTVALAQDDSASVPLPDVEVTVGKRPEPAQTVAGSITVLDHEDLKAAGVRTVADAIRLAPNVNLVEFSARRLHFPFVRGVGAGQGAPAVTTYVDGVPQLSANTASLNLSEVERIEFIRGPLGTLYGRNTLGGAINIVTREPRGHWTGGAAVGVGTHELATLDLTLAGPLAVDRLFASAAFGFETRDGYTDNTATDREVDEREAYHGRVSLLWLLDDEWSIRLTLAGERDRDGAYTLTELDGLRARPHSLSQELEGYTDRDVFSPSLELRRETDSWVFTSITGLSTWQIEELADVDFSTFDFRRRYTREEQWSLSQELRLASPTAAPLDLGNDLTLDWMLGASFIYSDFESSSYTETTAAAVSAFQAAYAAKTWTEADVETWAVGIFGEATLTVSETWALTLGLRYDHEQAEAAIRDYTDPVVPGIAASRSGDESWDALLPHIVLAWYATDDLMPYLSLSRGYRPGGFNLNAPAGQTTYDDETAWSWEAGLKSQWLEDRLTLNLSAFYIDWEDMQIYLAETGTGRFYVDNAGSARSYGAELEARYLCSPLTELFGGIGYTHAEFEDFTDPFSGSADGNALPFAPEYTWNGGVEQVFPLRDGLELYGRAELTGTGRFYYSASNQKAQRPYVLTHVRGGLRGEHWYLEAWMRNLTDEEYIPVAFQFTSSFFVGESGAPRTAGVTLGLTW